jgi:hypothetical protein
MLDGHAAHRLFEEQQLTKILASAGGAVFEDTFENYPRWTAKSWAISAGSQLPVASYFPYCIYFGKLTLSTIEKLLIPDAIHPLARRPVRSSADLISQSRRCGRRQFHIIRRIPAGPGHRYTNTGISWKYITAHPLLS